MPESMGYTFPVEVTTACHLPCIQQRMVLMHVHVYKILLEEGTPFIDEVALQLSSQWAVVKLSSAARSAGSLKQEASPVAQSQHSLQTPRHAILALLAKTRGTRGSIESSDSAPVCANVRTSFHARARRGMGGTIPNNATSFLWQNNNNHHVN